MLKRSLGLPLLAAGTLISGMFAPGSAIAAEYQGRTIDGQKFEATAYSHESGGTFDVQVQFKNKRATLYFVNGSQQSIQLDRREIEDPQHITGWGRPFGVRLGGFFKVGLSDNRSLHNTEPTGMNSFQGLWTISLKEDEINQSLTPDLEQPQ